jgi:single-strand DNA-binding protein
MASLNKVTLMGNLGADPEVRYLPNGDAVANLRLATTEKYKDKSGTKQEKTEWHRIVMYRGLAELANKWLKKGSSIYLEGKLTTRKWSDKAGVEHYTTEIVADEMQFLSGNRTGSTGAASNSDNSKPANGGGGGTDSTPPGIDDDNDIPFVTTSIGADPIFARHARKYRGV